jgi:transposase InsO family protein
MELKLHVNATTTPKTRAYIQNSTSPVARLAVELGVSETTIRRWRERREVLDRSHAPKHPRISLTPAEEQLVVELRQQVGLPFEDVVEVMQRCVRAQLSRSAIYRCLRRHGIASRPAAPVAATGVFEQYPFGFVHVDLKHLPRLQGQPAYVLVAIERVTRFVYVDIVTKRDAQTIAGCLERFLESFGHKVHTILTDNGSEFTDRFGGARWQPEGRTPSGKHPFDRVCARAGIKHRLTKPFHPQTNGMVERFNRRIAEALRNAPAAPATQGKNRFQTHTQRNRFITRFVDAYNKTRLRCINYKAPVEAIANQAKDNTCAGMTVWTENWPRSQTKTCPRRRLQTQASPDLFHRLIHVPFDPCYTPHVVTNYPRALTRCG